MLGAGFSVRTLRSWQESIPNLRLRRLHPVHPVNPCSIFDQDHDHDHDDFSFFLLPSSFNSWVLGAGFWALGSGLWYQTTDH